MRTGWIALIAMVGWSGAADARPVGSKPTARGLLMGVQWKSPVKAAPDSITSEQRWRLADPVRYRAADAPAVRWRLHGAGLKLRMPLAFH